ncbi:MAG: hypothetical protein MUE41_03715, partial [Gemmatimonadaceae bacterium]|nr:hypothetical protein [Gemmatimonadaceae bacterium]
MALAAVIVAVLGAVAAQRLLYETSIEAVVNAPRVEIEAPTEGVIDAMAIEPGRAVRRGTVLLTLRRDAWSRGIEGELGARAAVLRTTLAAMTARAQVLDALRDSLARRVAAHRAATLREARAARDAAWARAQERALPHAS